MSRSLYASLFTLALIGLSGSRAEAQIITILGQVTSSSGIYSGSASIGDPVFMQFQITDLTDAFDGALGTTEAAYSCDFSSLAVNGILQPLPNAFIFALDSGTTSGIFGNHTWNGFPFPDGGFSFQLESSQNVLPAIDFFPGDIPFSDFDQHAGTYFTQGDGSDGVINWNITSYSGSFGQSPVPEPSTYGMFAAVGLIGVAIRRRLARK